MPRALLRPSFALLLTLAALVPACAAPTGDEDLGETESAAVAAATAIADVDAAGAVTVRAGVLTLSFDTAARFEDRDGKRALVLVGRASRNLSEIQSFVPDDAFGKTTLTGPRTFEVVLRDGHEINTVLSGLPLGLKIKASNGSPRNYEAAVHLGGTFGVPTGDTRLRVLPEIRPVHAGTAADPLRYRVRIETTRTPDAIAITTDEGGATATMLRRSARRYDADWSYAPLAAAADRAPGQGAAVHFVAIVGATSATTDAKIDLRVRKLGLTTTTIEQAWPKTCDATVQRCVARETQSGATDLGECGTYRQVQTCIHADPPPPPAVTTAEGKIAADVLAKTGLVWKPSVLTVTQDGTRKLVLTSLGRGGSAEFAVGPGTAVSLQRFVNRPNFGDSSLISRFEGQLRGQHAMAGATIVAHGTPLGGNARWQFIVDRNGARSTVALQATSATESQIIPFQYDEGSFRQIAGMLAVERGIAMASQAGPYAELEVYLRAMVKLATASGLVMVAAADSPVGFVPATESQLGFYSLWGDNAVFVTMTRASGAVRVEDFN